MLQETRGVNWIWVLLMFLFLGVASGVSTGKAQAPNPSAASRFTSFTHDGAWCWFSDPRALFYEGDHRRVYAGWVSSQGDIVVGYYDLDTGAIQSEVLAERFQADDHNHPSLLVGPDGRLHVYFSKHATGEPILMVQSARPEEISSWEPTDTLDLNNTRRYEGYSDTYTYSHPVYLAAEQKHYLFWRGSDFKPNMSISADGGESWSKSKIFILPPRKYRDRRPYLKVASNGTNTIHFAFTQGHPRRESANSIYYMRYRRGQYQRADGSIIRGQGPEADPVRPTEADLVYDASQPGASKAWVWDVAYDGSTGHPVIVYARFPDDSTHIYSYARWNGSRWENHELLDAGPWFPETPNGETEPEPNYSGGISLDHEEPDIVYLSRQKNGTFEIEKWETPDNGATWDKTPVTRHSSNDNVRPAAVRNAKKGNPVQFLWMSNEHYIHYTRYKSHIKIPVRNKDE